MTEDSEWGLAAAGRHGSIEIDLNEPLQVNKPWLLQLSGTGWHLAINVSGPGILRELSEFVQNHNNRNLFAEFRVGSFQGADVMTVKDSEFADRFWLRVLGIDELLEITIAGESAQEFQKALKDTVSDLK